MKTTLSRASWLVPFAVTNTHTLFRGEWESVYEGEAELSFAMIGAADMWLNGEPIKATQPDDCLPQISVTTVPVKLCRGKNQILLNLHAHGRDFFSHMEGNYGFSLAVSVKNQVVFQTTPEWEAAEDIRWSQKSALVTVQLSWSFDYDARKTPEWGPCRVDTAFQPEYIDRVLPIMQEKQPPFPRALGCGLFQRTLQTGTPAEQCWSDLLQPRLLSEMTTYQPDPRYSRDYFVYVGKPDFVFGLRCPEEKQLYVILDLGQEIVGYLDFEVEAADGVQIDICHGEHLVDGRVRCAIDTRNFADRYTCREGINRFTSRMRRYGARYLELHLSGEGAGQVLLHRFTLIPVHAALPEEGGFHCSDGVLNQIRDISRNTLDCCMHDHYEDCPWREQALYAYDSRNQALFGYGLWGNYAFARRSFVLLGKNELAPGLLQLTAPSRFDKTIPIFSLAWIMEMAEYQLYSGDLTLAQEEAVQIQRVLKQALARMDQNSGLALQPAGEKSWNFFEWVPALEDIDAAELVAPYNLYLAEALDASERLLPGNGYHDQAEQLRQRVVQLFRDADGFYRTTLNPQFPRHLHTQALALFQGLPISEEIVHGAADLVEITYSALPYLVRGLVAGTLKMRQRAEELIYSNYVPMLKAGATTFWETPMGETDFRGAGSLCHGWSALGAWYCQNVVLGIEPLTDGFQKFQIRPYAGHLDSAQGRIPTPRGFISVQWQKTVQGLNLKVRYPQGLEPVLAPFPECPVVQADICAE